VIVALTARALEDIRNEVQTSRADRGSLESRIDLALGGTGGNVDAGLGGFGLALVFGVVGNESTLDLVGMDNAGLLAICLGDLFQIGIWADLEEV
jgi:hypothetical protein